MSRIENNKVTTNPTISTGKLRWVFGAVFALVLAACSGDGGTGDAGAPLDTDPAVGEDARNVGEAETDPAGDATVTTTTSIPPTPAGTFCEIELSNVEGTIHWNDAEGRADFDEPRAAVLRRNDQWFYSPSPDEKSVVVPGVFSANDTYVLRLWDNDVSEDISCTFTEGATTETLLAAPQVADDQALPAAPAPRETVALPTPIAIPDGPVQFGFAYGLRGDERTAYWAGLDDVPNTGQLIAHEFKSFTREIDTELYRWHIESGRELLLTWNGTDAETILNGSQDEWIREHARELSSLQDTIKLRFWHEPDQQGKLAWIDNDPQQFIDSWNYVRQIFAQEEAVNIEWVWCPTAWNWSERGAQFYPGDDNVDWICADGYSGWTVDNPLPNVANAFNDFQAWADQRPDKPILIAEFGAQERDPGERAAWIEQIPAWVSASPSIRAVVYFDVDMRPNGEPFDWRIRTEPDAWQTALDVISSAPFGR